MKTEREIAELVFDVFRNAKCRAGHVVMEGAILSLVKDLTPPESDLLLGSVLYGLDATEYISHETGDVPCFRLSEKGYDYIYNEERIKEFNHKPWVIPSAVKPDWNKAFNHLWEIINESGSQYYFSQTPFYNKVLSINASLPPVLGKYLEQRDKQGKSRTRKYFYFDLIEDMSEEMRYEFYASIQMFIEDVNNQPIPKDEIDMVSFWNQPVVKPIQTEEPVKAQVSVVKPADKPIEKKRPKVFISYAWGEKGEYKPWVKKLADILAPEIDVILDQNELGFGSHLSRFMTNGIEDSERILVVLTPLYKKRSKEIKGGTAFEEAIISAELLGDIDSRRILPILLEGNKETSAPLSIKGLIYCDMTDEKLFDTRIEELKNDILSKFEKDKSLIK